MHLKAHRYFVMVAATGSFSTTARHFQVPASSVSRFVASLEAEIGQQLLYRNTRSVKLTDAGERYYAQIRSVLELLDAADDEIAGEVGSVRGLVRLNAPAVFGRLHLAKLVIDLQSLHPFLITELILTDEIIDPVKEGPDVIFRIGSASDSGLIGRTICDQRYVLCASPDYLKNNGEPKTPEQLRDHQCLMHKGNGGLERWFFRNGETGIALKIDVTGHLRSNNSEVLLQAALAGKGIGIFPTWLLSQDSFKKDALRMLLLSWESSPKESRSQMFLLSPENKLRSQKVRAVWDYLLSAIGSPPYWDSVA